MHGKIKQLFMISCAFVPLFFNGHAFCFPFRCQAHACGLHRPFVDNSPTHAGYLLWFRDRKEAHPRAASCAIGTKKGLSTLPMDRPFEVLLLEV
ncbi:MAG: hypothetical protein ACFNJR_04840 [Segatella oulorum]